jgi:hypothetical protein
MSEEGRLHIVSRRRVFWLAAIAAALALPATMLPTSDARAQSDQAPAAEPTTPKKKTKSTKSKSKTKTKKTTPADTTAPAANPPAAPKQQ